MHKQGDMAEGFDQRCSSKDSWQTYSAMISLQRAEFFAWGPAGQKFGFVATREHRILFSSAALAQPVDLAHLRTTADSGPLQVLVVFLVSTRLLLRSMRGFPFPGPPTTARSSSVSRAQSQRPCSADGRGERAPPSCTPSLTRGQGIQGHELLLEGRQAWIEGRAACVLKRGGRERKGGRTCMALRGSITASSALAAVERVQKVASLLRVTRSLPVRTQSRASCSL